MKLKNYKNIALAIFLTGISGISTASAEESFTPTCENRDAVIAGLASEYSEQPVSMGYTAQGTIIEILASPDGGWSMIESSPNGTTCLVANGDMWRDTNKPIETRVNSGSFL